MMRKTGEIATVIVPRLATLRRWRIALLVFLILLLVLPLCQLRISDPAIYRLYVQNHITNYLDLGRGVYINTLHNDETEDAVHESFNFSAPCENFPDTEGILLVMKTGATEAYEKLPTHFVTHMQCLPDFLLFSDMEQQIGKYHLYDALDRVNETIRDTQDEFDLYKAMQDCPVSQAECTRGMQGAWVLDKYKFLWMAVKTWELRPDMDWYVFAEADSYILWSNLAYWLRNVQSHEGTQYFGSRAALEGFSFAHGGSGFAMSGTLLKKIATEIPNVGHKYDQMAPTACCGDYLMALAADEVGVRLQDVWPMFNGEKLSTLGHGPGQWCEPLLTMHHMNAEEISMAWQYEQTRKQEDRILIKDLYRTFFAPKLVPLREDWSNLSNYRCFVAPDEESQNKATALERQQQVPDDRKNAVERHAHENAEACSRVCEAEGLEVSAEEYDALGTAQERGDFLRAKYHEKSAQNKDWHRSRLCFQWSFRNGVCCTSWSFKLGMPMKEEREEDRWTSGWFVEGINDWIETQGECEGAKWTTPRQT